MPIDLVQTTALGGAPSTAVPTLVLPSLPPEIVGEIIDLSESARDVLPWLFVSHSVAERAVTAPAFSKHIRWPPKLCTMATPNVDGLKRMLAGALVPRGINLDIRFRKGAFPAYIASVMRLVSDAALPLTTSLRLCFYLHFDTDAQPPALAGLLDRPAPRLERLHLAVRHRAPNWRDAGDVELFQGHAPRLRVLKLTGVDAPLRRVPAFDAVQTLDAHCVLAYRPLQFSSQSVLGGCDNLAHLVVRSAGSFSALESAVANEPLGRFVGRLSRLDVYLRYQRRAALRVLELLGREQMNTISAVGDEDEELFPEGLAASLLRTLPQLAVSRTELVVEGYPRHPDPSFYIAIKFVLPGSPPRRRIFLIPNVPSSLPHIQVLGEDIMVAGPYFFNVSLVTISMSFLHLLFGLVDHSGAFPSLVHLDVPVDDFEVRRNPDQLRTSAPALKKVMFYVPERYTRLFQHGVPVRAIAIVKEWIDYGENRVEYDSLPAPGQPSQV